MAFRKEDSWTTFTKVLPDLLEDNNLEEVIAAISDELDNRAIDMDESSNAYKDISITVDALQALCLLTGGLNYGWTKPGVQDPKFQSRIDRNRATFDFKQAVSEIDNA